VTLIVGVALLALIVVAYFLWWPSVLQGLQGIHRPPPGVHGPQ
jgi:hypothetical protein